MWYLSFRPDDELLIERSIHKGMINPGEEKQTVEYKSLIASIEYTIRVRCDEHYYGSKCNKVCRPRDDYFGHYVCDQLGNRECMEGWTNLMSSCKTGTVKAMMVQCTSFYTDWQNTLDANQINQIVYSQIKWKAIKKTETIESLRCKLCFYIFLSLPSFKLLPKHHTLSSVFPSLPHSTETRRKFTCQVSLCEKFKERLKTCCSWRHLQFTWRCLFHPLLSHTRSSAFSQTRKRWKWDFNGYTM